MAVTQYQIFCRYLNENVNRPLTNQTKIDWINAEEINELNKFYAENQAEYEEIIKLLLQPGYAYEKGIPNVPIDGVLRLSQLSVQQLNIYTEGKRYDEIQDKLEKKKIAVEHCILEPADSLYSDSNNSKKRAQMARDLELYQYVIEETAATNPKYDMVFIYDGIAYAESRTGKADYNPAPDDDKQVPYVYYEKMKRIKLDPWFLFSTHASLNSAMVKARELVNILGKDAVKIGKVVPLDQYIEIV